ncbi:MAG: hypothetical protein OXI81_21395 [Paracoccaceae bacterium]|nr:hypothetical protein [Paracoccaceae bacterium]
MNRGKPAPACLHPPEEPLEGLVQALESAPLDRHCGVSHAGQGAAADRERLRLVDVGDRPTRLSVAVDTLLQRRVVQLPLGLERAVEPAPVRPLLRKQPIGDVSEFCGIVRHARLTLLRSFGVEQRTMLPARAHYHRQPFFVSPLLFASNY